MFGGFALASVPLAGWLSPGGQRATQVGRPVMLPLADSDVGLLTEHESVVVEVVGRATQVGG